MPYAAFWYSGCFFDRCTFQCFQHRQRKSKDLRTCITLACLLYQCDFEDEVQLSIGEDTSATIQNYRMKKFILS